MKMLNKLTRRDFLKLSAVAGIGTALSAALLGCGGSGETENNTPSSPANTSGADKTGTAASTASVSQAAQNANAENLNKDVEGVVKSVICGYKNDTGSLDPMLASRTANRNDVARSIYETLIEIDPVTKELDYIIAKSFTKVDDLTYDCEIYEGICDSEGTPITVDDVKWCFDTAMASGNYQSVVKLIESVEKLDEKTLRFKIFSLDEVTAGGLYSGISGGISIVSQKAYEASADNFASSPVGTGPYVVEEFVGGSHITMSKNENYWQKDAAALAPQSRQNVDDITFKIITDQSQIAIALQTGSIDMSKELQTADFVLFEEGGESYGKFNVFTGYKNMTYQIQFNCSQDSPCNNINLRKAIAYSFDAKGIMQSALNGRGELTYALSCAYFPDYDEDALKADGYYAMDTGKAEELLKTFKSETGTDATSLTLKILAQTQHSGVAEALLAYMEGVGLKAELNILDHSMCVLEVAKSDAWDLYIFDSAGSTTAGAAQLSYWEDRYNNGLTQNFVDDAHLQELVKTAGYEKTASKEATTAYFKYIEEQCYAVGLFRESYISVSKPFVIKVYVGNNTCIVPGACDYDWTLKD